VLNAADVQGYLMDQAVMVFAGTAARGSAIPTPSAGMVAYSTATQLQVYNGSAWVDLSTGYGAATGGTSSSITVGGVAYTLLTFTSDSNLVVSKAGLFDIIIVGGGGGGHTGDYGGGGGAGGVIESTISLGTATYAVDIGAGGSGIAWTATGAPTAIGSQFGYKAVASGGGAGSISVAGDGIVDRQMASGGGGYRYVGPGTGTSGGSGGSGIINAGGGGGGATANGGAGSGTTGGAGGAGTSLSTFTGGTVGTSVGGGGGGGGSSAGGAGGTGGGGAGGTGAGASGSSGTANTGGGGGGGNSGGGSGGSGVLYVRFKV
jgi:hypothetical protein